MIGILDYGMGNIRSVSNALEFVGAEACFVTPDEMDKAGALVLPGVGAFRDTARLLEPYRGDLLGFIESGRPFLGICVGLQYLFEESLENGRWKGLGVFRGQVSKLTAGKLPQIGWNTLAVKVPSSFLEGVQPGSYVYYINSYGAPLADAAATTRYGNEFAAVMVRDNVFATQFHPEKSGDVGLGMLRNFRREAEACL